MKVFLTHSPEARANYYADAPLAALRAVVGPENLILNETPGRDSLAGRELAEAAKGCQIIISFRTSPGTAELFANAPDLVAFMRVAVDCRNIDLEAANSEGILVTRATPGFAASVAELIVGQLVDLSRGITASTIAYRNNALSGQTQPPDQKMGRQLKSSTLGIVGYGTIGKYLANLGLAFGMNVLYSDPDPAAVPLDPRLEMRSFDDLLSASDFVVCLAISNDQTLHLFNAESFSKMKPGSYFLNPSRGQLVSEPALLSALNSGHLAGAALDVGMAPDQMPSPELACHPKVIATPHVGGLTPQAAEHQAFDTVRQVEALLKGKVPEGALNAHRATKLERIGVRN